VAGVSGIDFALDRGGSVRGTVFAEDGLTSLSNVALGVDGTWLRDCTDAGGTYDMRYVPLNESFTLVAGGLGWCPGSAGYYREWWEEADTHADATGVILTAGQLQMAGIDFTLEPICR